MNVTNEKWKYKMAGYMWYIYIPEGLIAKWDNYTSEILVDKWFEPTTEYEIIEFIDTIFEQGILVGKGKIQNEFSEYSRQNIFTALNIGHHGTGMDRYWQIISNLCIKQ